MPNYRVRFRDQDGLQREVVLTCADEDQVRRYCASKKFVVESIAVGRPRNVTQVEAPATSVVATAGRKWLPWQVDGPRVRSQDLALAFSQAHFMMAQGTTLHASLLTLSKSHSGDLSSVLLKVLHRVETGNSLSSALAMHPTVFADSIVSAVRVGEESGRLTQVMGKVGTWLEKGNEVRQRLQAALVYPALILLLCGLMGTFMLTVMLPEIIGSLQIAPSEMPTLTRVLMFAATSVWVRLGLLGLGCASVGLWSWAKSSPERERKMTQHFYRLPVIGKLARSIALSNWLDRLGLLMSSGLDLYQCLRLTSEGIRGPQEMLLAVAKLPDHIRMGASLSVAFSAYPEVFPRGLVSMTACAEEVGGIEPSLQRFGTMLETETESRIGDALTLLEPLLMGAMGVMVGTLVVAIFLPLYARLV